MEPIFDLPADLPAHAETPLVAVEATVVTTWPVGTFVENLAVLPDGGIIVAVHTANAVERVELDGRRTTVATLPAPPAGLVAREDGGFYVAGDIPGAWCASRRAANAWPSLDPTKGCPAARPPLLAVTLPTAPASTSRPRAAC